MRFTQRLCSKSARVLGFATCWVTSLLLRFASVRDISIEVKLKIHAQTCGNLQNNPRD